MDVGFNESDKILERLERKLHSEYAKASREMTKKANDYFVKFAAEDKQMREKYKDGKISKREFIEWRERKMLRGKYWTGMKERLANDLVNTDKLAMAYVHTNALDTYALNMNFGTYSIEKESRLDTAFTVYNRDAVLNIAKNNPNLLPKNTNPQVDIPKDKRWNKQHINSAITQGILQGESVDKVAKRLQKVTDMGARSAVKNARTAMTSAQNAGRLDSMRRAKERGIGVKKAWMATLDSRTRDSHKALDGEVRDLDEEFSNGLMHPGDPNGDPSEVYNCRCRLVHEFDRYSTDWTDMRNRYDERLGGMSYDEWKSQRTQKTATKEKLKEEQPKTNKEYEADVAKLLKEIHTTHRALNHLENTPAEDIGDEWFQKKSDFGSMDARTAKAFTETLSDLSKQYDTSLGEVARMQKLEFLEHKNAFAYVEHDYELDVSKLHINPIKCGDYEKLVDRIKELASDGYAVKIDEKLAHKYVATHEFAHTLIDMQTPLRNKRNWVKADYPKIKKARKEIEAVYTDYLDKRQKIEAEFQKYELDFLNTFSQASADKAVELEKQLNAMTVSKYGNENSDEFMAECFTLRHLGVGTNEYADRIMDILDKYFGRK